MFILLLSTCQKTHHHCHQYDHNWIIDICCLYDIQAIEKYLRDSAIPIYKLDKEHQFSFEDVSFN